MAVTCPLLAFVFILIVLLIYVLPVAEPVPSRKYLWFKRMTAVLSVFMAMHFVFDCYYNMKWAAMYKRSQKGDTERMLLHYKKMKSRLLNNPYFLYNYSAELNLTGRYEESNSIAEECVTMMNDYDVQMLLADNHFNLCNYDEALKRYETAHYMCPDRFAPMYKKFSRMCEKHGIRYYLAEVSKASHREYTTAFYYGKPDGNQQVYTNNSYIREYDFIGMVQEDWDAESGYAVIEQRNKFSVGEEIEVMPAKGDSYSMIVTELINANGESVESAPHPQEILKMKFDRPVHKFDMLRKIPTDLK